MRFIGVKWDKLLFLGFMLISVIGVLSIYSATWTPHTDIYRLDPFVLRQMVWVAAGFLIMLMVANTDHLKLADMGYILYALNLLALVAVLLFSPARYGARRWIQLGFFSFQPSEFVKITSVLALASFLGEKKETKGSFGNFIGAMMLIAPSFILIFLQPDLGTAMVLVPIMFFILLVAEERVKYIITVAVMGIASLPVLWQLLRSYQKQRLLVFINPNADPLGAGYTIIQSRIAIGSGGLWGKGFLGGTQSYLRFLPERHTDFIFSVIGEQWGFIGASVVILIFALVIWRGITITKKSKDVFARCISAGIVSLFFFQVFVNIAMTMGLTPVVGLPLPAVSYGGSNTITSFIAIGILLSVSRRVS